MAWRRARPGPAGQPVGQGGAAAAPRRVLRRDRVRPGRRSALLALAVVSSTARSGWRPACAAPRSAAQRRAQAQFAAVGVAAQFEGAALWLLRRAGRRRRRCAPRAAGGPGPRRARRGGRVAHAPSRPASTRPAARPRQGHRSTLSRASVSRSTSLAASRPLDFGPDARASSRWPPPTAPRPGGRRSRVGPRARRPAQQAQRLVEVAHAVFHPAQAVGDEGVAGRQFQRALHQLARLGQPQAAVGQRIAQRIVGVGVVGLELDHAAQQPSISSRRSSFSAIIACSYSRSASSGKRLRGLAQHLEGLAASA